MQNMAKLNIMEVGFSSDHLLHLHCSVYLQQCSIYANSWYHHTVLKYFSNTVFWEHGLMCDVMLWKTLIGVSIDFFSISRIGWNIFDYLPSFETCFQGDINKVLQEWGVGDRHLVADFENYWAEGSRLERVPPQNFFRNCQISSETPETSVTCFCDPNAPVKPIVTWISSQEPPQNCFSFREPDERGWKSTLSAFSLKEVS